MQYYAEQAVKRRMWETQELRQRKIMRDLGLISTSASSGAGTTSSSRPPQWRHTSSSLSLGLGFNIISPSLYEFQFVVVCIFIAV